MLSSLNLADDDDLDLLHEIEHAFGIPVPPEASRSMRTLGDMHAWLLRALPAGPDDGRCPTAMAFYRLRAALQTIAPQAKIRPGTQLRAIVASPAKLLRTLRKRSGLKLPAPKARWRGLLGGAVVLIGGLVCAVALADGHLAAAAIAAGAAALGWLLALTDDGNYLDGIVTLGDLSRRAAAFNHRAFRAQGARRMPDEEWSVLAAIAADLTGGDADQIDPDTFFYQAEYEKSRVSLSA